MASRFSYDERDDEIVCPTCAEPSAVCVIYCAYVWARQILPDKHRFPYKYTVQMPGDM